MSSVRDLVEILAELFGWIGLILSVLCFLALLILRSTRGSWEETEAVVVDDGAIPELRWMTTEGILHTRELNPDEREAMSDPEQLHIHYSRRAPHRIRFEVVGHGEKVMRALGFIFLGIGAVAFIVSLIVLFIPL